MRIEAIDGHIALCSASGVQREVNLFLLQDESLAKGDFVMVHVGYAIQRVNPQLAMESQDLYRQMQGQDPRHA